MYLVRMILVALSAFVAGVSMAQAAPLSCDEAREHLREEREVCGLVASARYLERGSRPTFLNSIAEIILNDPKQLEIGC
jgi:hypothetical protein